MTERCKNPFEDTEYVKRFIEVESAKIEASRLTKEKVQKFDEELQIDIEEMKVKHPPPSKEKRFRRKKQPTNKERRENKQYMLQLWDEDDINKMVNKRPPNDPRGQPPLNPVVMQEKADKSKFHPSKSGHRLIESPNTVLTETEFDKFGEDFSSLSEEEQINLMLNNAERYERAHKRWLAKLFGR